MAIYYCHYHRPYHLFISALPISAFVLVMDNVMLILVKWTGLRAAQKAEGERTIIPGCAHFIQSSQERSSSLPSQKGSTLSLRSQIKQEVCPLLCLGHHLLPLSGIISAPPSGPLDLNQDLDQRYF